MQYNKNDIRVECDVIFSKLNIQNKKKLSPNEIVF